MRQFMLNVFKYVAFGNGQMVRDGLGFYPCRGNRQRAAMQIFAGLVSLSAAMAAVFVARGATTVGYRHALPLPPVSMRLKPHEDQYLNRFGSKFGIQFYPHHVGLLPAGLGPRHNRASLTDGVYTHALLGVAIDRHRYILPLLPQKDFGHRDVRITDFTLHRTMTSADLRSTQYPQGVSVRWKFISPFYPRALRLSLAPAILVRCTINNHTGSAVEASVLAGLPAGGATMANRTKGIIERHKIVHVIFRGPETDKYPKNLPETQAIALSGASTSTPVSMDHCTCFQNTLVVAPGASQHVWIILAQYVNTRSVVSYFGTPCEFEYQKLFPGIDSVIHYARHHRRSMLLRSRIFDHVISGAALPLDIKAFIARNFQVYLGATWMLHRPDGKLLFTSYEGGTGYFSTIDVEFNLAPFYVMFWPACLKSELNLWAKCYYHWPNLKPYRTGPGGPLIWFGPKYGVMEHDVGGGFIISRQVYLLGPMPVEENSNYILLNSLYWRYTGKLDVFRRHEKLCLALANYILHSSTDGTGLPDTGTNNTLDGFGTLHRRYPDQVFLGLKAACALQALVSMLRAAGQSQLTHPYAAREKLIIHSIEKNAWQGNHYAITISPRHPKGWNKPWALTTNALLYDLLTGEPQPLKPSRVRSDLLSQINKYSKWPSMGIWRDMIACYFGIHPHTRYVLRPDFFGDMYPRSFNSIAMIQAWAGIGINVPKHRITISSRARGWFPLPALADWKAEKVPWIRVHHGKIELRQADLLKGLQVSLSGSGRR
ncbi:MAG: glycoside hydrolase family 52 protein [Phycisphaerae bacterium]